MYLTFDQLIKFKNMYTYFKCNCSQAKMRVVRGSAFNFSLSYYPILGEELVGELSVFVRW